MRSPRAPTSSSGRSSRRSRSSSASTNSSSAEHEAIGTLYIDESAGERQLARLDDTRARGAIGRASNAAIERLQTGAQGESNLMPLLIDAVRAMRPLERCATACGRSGASTSRIR